MRALRMTRRSELAKSFDVQAYQVGGHLPAGKEWAGASVRAATETIRRIALDTLVGAAELDDEIMVEEVGGQVRYIAPVSEDILEAVRGDSVVFERSHRVFRAEGEILEQLRTSVGSSVRFAEDPGSGDIVAIASIQPASTPAVLSKRPLYASIPEMQSSRPEPKPPFPSFDQIRSLHYALKKQPHIPFLYPPNGCWARAEAMCRLLIDYFGISGRLLSKVWISCNQGYDDCLTVTTNINPKCRIKWDWHVAPLLEGKFRYWVLDPSLSDEPVKIAQWRSIMNATKATARFQYSTWERYGFRDKFDIDPPVKEKELPRELAKYRDLLSAQIFNDGPIPYKKCISM